MIRPLVFRPSSFVIGRQPDTYFRRRVLVRVNARGLGDGRWGLGIAARHTAIPNPKRLPAFALVTKELRDQMFTPAAQLCKTPLVRYAPSCVQRQIANIVCLVS
jgi:hypothetical protein